jgi:hypothetical protein
MEGPHAKFKVLKKGTKKVVVRPPSDHAKKSQGSVEVKNNTDDQILVNMPGGVFDSGGAEPDPPKVHSVNAKSTLTLPVHAKAADGAYDFQIFSRETFAFAEANSDPEFIID